MPPLLRMSEEQPEMAPTPTPHLSPQRRLPLEMIETIIDHLHDDRKALEACSLVCKALTPRAQFQLFSNMTLNLRHRNDLVQLTQSALTVVPFIRRLHLDYYHMNAFDINLQLLVGFKAIESLTVSDLQIRRFDSQRISSLFANTSITGATVLRLIDIRSRYVFQLAHVICAFPRLQKLAISVENDSWIDDVSIPTGLCPSPHLTALQLGYFGSDGMLNWLMSLPMCPALRTVSLLPSFSNDIWMEFLLRLKDSLESLFLDIRGLDQTVDLYHHKRLRSVQLVLDGTDWTVPELSQLPPQLDEIVFDFLLGPHEYPILDGLSELDQVLQSSSFSKLKKVAVRYLWTRWPEISVTDLSGEVMDQMPQCHARGILRVRQAVHQFLHF